MTRHEFLAALHTLLKPKVYLEIGVQWGTSLDLADQTITQAYGVDPDPLVDRFGLFRLTSDQFYEAVGDDGDEILGGPVDLGFIDGQHLVEYALRDFIGMERLCAPTGVIVFDDVLPRNQAEAARKQCPGDWTGDVWRIDAILQRVRPDLDILLVDTAPTGTLVVSNLDPSNTALTDFAEEIASRWPPEGTWVVPDEILRREHAWPAGAALENVADWWRVASAQRAQATS